MIISIVNIESKEMKFIKFVKKKKFKVLQINTKSFFFVGILSTNDGKGIKASSDISFGQKQKLQLSPIAISVR